MKKKYLFVCLEYFVIFDILFYRDIYMKLYNVKIKNLDLFLMN